MTELPDERPTLLPTQLIRQAHGGDAAAAAALFAELRLRLSRIVAIDLGRPTAVDDADVEDLVQDSLLEAIRDFGSFTPQSSGDLLRWLVAITRNNLRDKKRWQRVRRGLEPLRTAMHSALAARDATSPAAAAAARELRARTDAAMLRLSEQDRHILLLRHYQLCSADEIARELGLPSAEAARARAMRARRRLQDLLAGGAIDLG